MKNLLLTLCLLALAGCSVFAPVEPPIAHSPWIKLHFSTALANAKCPNEACAIGYLQEDGVTVDPLEPCHVYLPQVGWESHIEHEVLHCFLGNYDRHLHLMNLPDFDPYDPYRWHLGGK